MKGTFVGIDWGSSKVHAYLMSHNEGLLEEKCFALKISESSIIDMENALVGIANNWSVDSVFASGMIGSSLGLMDVPYLPCPVVLDELLQHCVIKAFAGFHCYFVPGLRCTSPHGDPELLRGEELEIFGWYQTQMKEGCYWGQQKGHVLCLPGTHTKWVHVMNGRIEKFSTTVSSELYDALAHSSVLKSQLGSAPVGNAEFLSGVKKGASQGQGLLRLLFSVRSRYVMKEMTLEDSASYARGLIIGAEINDMLQHYPPGNTGTKITVIGNAPLSALYVFALKQKGYDAQYFSSREALIQAYITYDDMREITDTTKGAAR